MDASVRTTSIAEETADILERLGVAPAIVDEGTIAVRSPITGENLGRLREANSESAEAAISKAHEAFRIWRKVPAPRRGELVRLLGDELRASKQDLARLVTIETGKIVSEAAGEVQEMIDICGYAVGLSRQLYGLTLTTERPDHRMMETWHPLGITGIISAFNFPVAVWSWNAALALVCGNPCVWKPSEKTPLTALATQALFDRAAAKSADALAGLSAVLIGDRTVGEILVDDSRVALVSATGSTAMGREVGPRVARRFARAILELGGNNAAIVCPSADLELTLRAVVFSAMGTSGQRCTTLRRLFVHEDVYDRVLSRLKMAYRSISIGDPRDCGSLVGPLIDRHAFTSMQRALQDARDAGGSITGGERVHAERHPEAFYVRPAFAEMPKHCGPVKRETFAPILYVMKYREFGDAISQHNDVSQGLSSSIFTTDIREAERFLAVDGSDCGIANVNLGPSGAEVGGAFGGEKETGGGREAGSNAWSSYMRRATNTINYGIDLPLAQGLEFGIG
jgi:aldehyde dehydrogenase (NAD+)